MKAARIFNRTANPPSFLKKAAGGDKIAIELVIDFYGNFLWSLAKNSLATNAEAERLVQEIFLNIWKQAVNYDEKNSKKKLSF